MISINKQMGSMEHVAYTTFVVIVCILYYRAIFATRNYGEQLRTLRGVCSRAIFQYEKDETFDTNFDTPHYVIVNKESGNIVGSNKKDDENDELVRLMKNIDSRQLSFQHAPDMENTSHIIALYKDETEKWACIAYMNT